MKASKNAFKGYSYQKSIYTYFLLKMDLERKISSVEAEITPEGHNFDDVLVCENDILYYIQTKNYENLKKVEITNNGIKSNGDLSIKSGKGINVFILKIKIYPPKPRQTNKQTNKQKELRTLIQLDRK